MMCTPTQGVCQPASCVSCELVCVCVSLVRVVIICPASTHTALVSSPSLAVLRLSINQSRRLSSCPDPPGSRTPPPQRFWRRASRVVSACKRAMTPDKQPEPSPQPAAEPRTVLDDQVGQGDGCGEPRLALDDAAYLSPAPREKAQKTPNSTGARGRPPTGRRQWRRRRRRSGRQGGQGPREWVRPDPPTPPDSDADSSEDDVGGGGHRGPPRALGLGGNRGTTALVPDARMGGRAPTRHPQRGGAEGGLVTCRGERACAVRQPILGCAARPVWHC